MFLLANSRDILKCVKKTRKHLFWPKFFRVSIAGISHTLDECGDSIWVFLTDVRVCICVEARQFPARSRLSVAAKKKVILPSL